MSVVCISEACNEEMTLRVFINAYVSEAAGGDGQAYNAVRNNVPLIVVIVYHLSSGLHDLCHPLVPHLFHLYQLHHHQF